MRVFVAVELPDDVKFRLARLGDALRPQAKLVKLVAPELLHITIRFLGNVEPSRLPAIERAAEAASSRVDRFALTIEGLGGYPSGHAPRVLWAGLRQDGGFASLQRLHSELETALQTAGFEVVDRAFSAHITLGRARDRITPAERRVLGDALREAQRQTSSLDSSFQVSALTVMRSDLGPGGPRYTPIAVYPPRGSHAGEGRPSTVAGEANE
ncbi:MAG TPA: RNA 2',3'-cyclic phosphodiesterase [Chloroflexota bacterium]